MFSIVRCCGVRLPGGIRKWVKLARLAGFEGTLYLRGFRPHDHERNGRIVLGRQFGNRIIVNVQAPCGHVSVQVDPLSTFAHELGHWTRQRNGLKNTNGIDFKSNTAQAKDPIEAYCDRYARRLLKRLRD